MAICTHRSDFSFRDSHLTKKKDRKGRVQDQTGAAQSIFREIGAKKQRCNVLHTGYQILSKASSLLLDCSSS